MADPATLPRAEAGVATRAMSPDDAALALEANASLALEAGGVPAAVSPLAEFWNDFSRNRGAVAGLVTVIALILIAIFANFVAPHSPIEQFREATLTPPAWSEGGSTRFLLGTDALGRDILSRLIYGSR